jgi:predicted nucleic acid-binding protein
MAFEPAVAVLDACVLYPFHLRNIIVQAAVDRLFEARWTDEIHQEWMLALSVSGNIPMERLRNTLRLMKGALPDATVCGYERHFSEISLPDPDDRHVLAAAIEGQASIIITWNLRHFPRYIRRFGVWRLTPDAFLADLYEKVPDLTIASLANARRNLTKSQISSADFIGILHDQRLVQLAQRTMKHLADL